MNKKQGIREIKYRLSLLQIQMLLEQGRINTEQFKIIKMELLKKYKPLVGSLELDGQRNNRNTREKNQK